MMVLDASEDVKHKFTLLKLSNHSFVLFIPVYARYHQQYFIQLLGRGSNHNDIASDE